MNIGISLLKIVSCVCIVIMHCGNSHRLVGLSVMIFMFTAMFLFGRKLTTDNVSSILCKRLKRIAIPYFAWGMIAAIPFSVFYKTFEFDKFCYQMLLGSPYDPPLYFMTLLALYTVLVWILSLLSMRVRLLAIANIVLFCWALQYTGINSIYTETLAWIPYFPRCTIGRFVELMPPALIGYFAGCGGGGFLPACCVFGIAGVFTSFLKLPTGYDYQGADLTLIASCICIAVILCDRFARTVSQYEKCNRITMRVAGLTVGIYVTHVLIANALSVLMPSIQKGPLLVFVVLTVATLVTMFLQRIRWLAWLVK